MINFILKRIPPYVKWNVLKNYWGCGRCGTWRAKNGGRTSIHGIHGSSAKPGNKSKVGNIMCGFVRNPHRGIYSHAAQADSSFLIYDRL